MIQKQCTESALELSHHSSRASSTLIINLLNNNTATTASAATDVSETSGGGCGDNDFLSATGTLDDFIINIFINCDDKTITVNITYSG